jgi:monothiol glutaredoxin
MALDETQRRHFDDLVGTNRVVLFMKGTRRSPSCGFSSQVVSILDELVPSYETIDVLTSVALRDGVKEYSQWPTIPQLYVDGRFVGGCDIVKEMHASGELGKLLGVSEALPTPAITITPAAAAAFAEAREASRAESPQTAQDELHLEIDGRYEYGLFFGPRDASEIAIDAGGLTLFMSRPAARRADGLTIDFIAGPGGQGFKMSSPHEPAKVKQLDPAELKAMMDRGDRFELVDVRTPKERATASLPGSHLLDEDGQKWLEGVPHETTVVFHCHHGGRSQRAAEHYVGLGFKQVFNLAGGIDAWSQTVDPTVPRY